MSRFNAGDIVHITATTRPTNWNCDGLMDKYLGKDVRVSAGFPEGYFTVEDDEVTHTWFIADSDAVLVQRGGAA